MTDAEMLRDAANALVLAHRSELAIALRALAARLPELERDAARWRYWRSVRHVNLVTAVFGNGASQTVEQAEAVIDAAMQEQPK